MSEEIKEILDIERYRNKDGYVENINLLPDEIHKLLDYITNLQNQLQQKENIIKEVREYVKQLLEYKKEDYYKGVSLEYIERIIDIINQDKRY